MYAFGSGDSARIKEAGIVGMGGAAFPTQVKLTVPAGKKVEHLIINGVELRTLPDVRPSGDARTE